MHVLSGIILAPLAENARGGGGGGGGGGGLACGDGKTCGTVADYWVVFGGTCGTIIAGLDLAVEVVAVCGVNGM